MTSWHQKARRLHEAGTPIRAIARAVGKGATTVRCALDINGEYARTLQANKQAKARQREALKGTRVRVELAPTRADRAVQAAYADKPAPRPLSLPRISLPDISEQPAPRKYAPRVRWTASPGAERWRQHHLAMIRAGKIPPRHDLTSEMQQ